MKGTAKKFSERGDSGSLVFCRPIRIKQNYVDVVGMVYANDLTLCEDDDADNDDPADQKKMKSKLPEGSWEEGTYNNEVKAKNEPSSSECDYPYKDNNTASGIAKIQMVSHFVVAYIQLLNFLKKIKAMISS